MQSFDFVIYKKLPWRILIYLLMFLSFSYWVMMQYAEYSLKDNPILIALSATLPVLFCITFVLIKYFYERQILIAGNKEMVFVAYLSPLTWHDVRHFTIGKITEKRHKGTTSRYSIKYLIMHVEAESFYSMGGFGKWWLFWLAWWKQKWSAFYKKDNTVGLYMCSERSCPRALGELVTTLEQYQSKIIKRDYL